MKLLMNMPILNIDGTEFKPEILNDEGNKMIPGKETLLLVDVIVTSLMSTLEGENKETGPEKLKRYELARRVEKARGTMLELTNAEGTFIQERVAKTHVTLVYGNVYEMIEAASDGKPARKTSKKSS